MVARCSRRTLAAVALAALAACGGGGGGGDGGGGLSVSLSKSSLQFVNLNGNPSRDSLSFTLTGGSGSYYAQILLDRPNLSAQVSPTSPTSAIVTLTLTSPAPGTASGGVTFRLCTDSSCSSVVWSRAVPYAIAAFTISTSSLAFAAAEGTAGAPQAIEIAPADTGHLLTASAAVPWLTVARDASSSTFQVTASAQTLAGGSYSGQVVVERAGLKGDGTSTAVPVTFDVATAMVAPPDATVALDLAGALTGSIPVAFRTSAAPAWTATADRAWLGLTEASGTGAGSVQYAIDPSKLDAIANWSSDVATVQISSAGLTPVTMRLTAQKRLPEIFMVSPPVVPEGQAATVHVFGKGLSQLTASSVDVSGASGVSAAASSDSEAAVSIASAAAGRAIVSVPNPYAVPTRSVELAVTPAGGWTAGKVAGTGEIGSAFFDPIRNAIYAVNSGQGGFVRYQLAAGTWSVDAVPVASIVDLGPSADRSTLYVTSGEGLYCTGNLRTFDPDTLLPGTIYTLPNAGGACLIGGSRYGLQATNNSRLWFHGSQWSDLTYFDMLTGQFQRHSGPSVLGSFASLYYGRYYASPDGSRMIVSQANGNPAYFYTSGDDRLAQPPIAAIYYGAASSRDGRVAITDNRYVYDTGTWAMRGRATVSGTGVMGTTAQISPDGAKAYVLVHSTADGYPIARIDVFDTSNLVQGTTDLVKLGEIPVADQPASCGASLPYGCNWIPVFLVGPLGDVIFLVGNQGLVVLPIPPPLAGAP